jgi:MEDS: MEthanogen/methylotroph, DcmR Sensory domain
MDSSSVGSPIILADYLDQQTGRPHICGFYKNHPERMQILAEYYRDGLRKNELCLCVTDINPSEFINDLEVYGLDIRDAVLSGRFEIANVSDTYIPGGKFDYEKMLAGLKGFADRALSSGFSGARGGGDLSWLSQRVPGWETASEYESRINQFMRENHFTCLCLFHTTLLDDDLTQSIVQTHPQITRSGLVHDNPYYAAPDGFFKPDSEVTSQIKRWVTGLDTTPANKQA